MNLFNFKLIIRRVSILKEIELLIVAIVSAPTVEEIRVLDSAPTIDHGEVNVSLVSGLGRIRVDQILLGLPLLFNGVLHLLLHLCLALLCLCREQTLLYFALALFEGGRLLQHGVL